MVDVNRFAVRLHEALVSVSTEEKNIGTYESLELAKVGSQAGLILIGGPQSPNNIGFALLYGPRWPVCWGAYTSNKNTSQLRRSCEHEFGKLPALDAGSGHFDSPAWRLANGKLLVGVAPSDEMHREVPTYMVGVAVQFFRLVARRLRLGVPQSGAGHGKSLAAVRTQGHLCRQCKRLLHATDVFCKNCGWSLSTGQARRDEELFPDFLPDT